MILSKKQHEAVHLYLLMLFSFLLPIHPRLAVLFIIFLGINWLFSGTLFSNFKQLLQPIPILFISFYLLHLFGLSYTENMAEGLQKIETKLPLLIFPLILFSFPINDEKDHFNILKSFVIGSIVASFYSVGMAIKTYFHTEENWMYYKKLGSFLGFHPTYFSMYIAFALFIVLFFLIKNNQTIASKYKLGGALLLGWFFLFILLLSSRMTILVTALILGLAFLIWMYSQNKLWKAMGIAALAIVLLGFSLKNLPGLKTRTNVTIDRIEKQRKNQGVSDPRVNLWSAALSVIQNNFILGTGTGDGQDELVKIYRERNYERELRDNFNPHNQYLQTSVTLGIIGGLLLFAYLFVPFWLAFRQQEYLYLFFLSLIILSFLTESVLQTQRGTLFVGFFHTLFALGFSIKKNHLSE